eukprot:5618873-Amphidinium_carterae.1
MSTKLSTLGGIKAFEGRASSNERWEVGKLEVWKTPSRLLAGRCKPRNCHPRLAPARSNRRQQRRTRDLQWRIGHTHTHIYHTPRENPVRGTPVKSASGKACLA